MTFLTDRPIAMEPLFDAVRAPAHGGIAIFVGAVRDHHGGRGVLRLEYSAYAPMVNAECARIVTEAETRWPARVALRHRVGTLGIGDTAIVAVAGAPHREAAFEACRYVVEEVKRRAPIWKQEHYADGTVGWVDPTAAPQASEERA